MDESKERSQESSAPTQEHAAPRDADHQAAWETPRMDDVSEQVTAQPYIRFT